MRQIKEDLLVFESNCLEIPTSRRKIVSFGCVSGLIDDDLASHEFSEFNIVFLRIGAVDAVGQLVRVSNQTLNNSFLKYGALLVTTLR